MLSVKEVDVVVVDVIVRLVILLNTDIHLALIDDLYVTHVLVYDVLVYLPCLLPQAQKILVITVP